MDLGLKDKVALVAGGSRGIGLACARAFHAEGARVCIVSRVQASLDRASSSLPGCYAMAADLTDPRASRQVVESVEREVGPIDILVNTAGAAKTNAPEDLTPEAYEQGMKSKYFTYIYMVDAAIKGMAMRRHGVILNVVGQGGKIAFPQHIAGGAANAALMLASTGFAVAYADKGIRVNVINRGSP